NFFQRRNAFSGELAPEPRPRIQPPQISKRHVVHSALSVRGTVHFGVVNGHETRVARKLQVRLDKRRPERNGFPECRQRVLRRVPRRPAMCNHQHYATLSPTADLDTIPPLLKGLSFRNNPIFPAVPDRSMLTPPPRTGARSQPPCILNLTG